jgi:ubiquitin C-terminal hydrolase
MNSVLQCVLLSPYLTEYIISTFPKEKKNRSTPVAQSFSELLQKVRTAGGAAVTPSDLKNQVSRTVSQFSGYGQQDAQEFLRFLLDRMHDELNRIVSKPKY